MKIGPVEETIQEAWAHLGEESEREKVVDIYF